jgi:hypothetical protein
MTASISRRIPIVLIMLSVALGAAAPAAQATSTVTYVDSFDADTVQWKATAGSNATATVSYRSGPDAQLGTADDVLRFSTNDFATIAAPAQDRCSFVGTVPLLNFTSVECRYRDAGTGLPYKTVVVQGSDGNDTLGLDAATMTLDRIGTTEFQLYGASGHDSVTGGPGDDLIMGGEGSDWLYDKAGADDVFGEAGLDTFYIHVDGASDWFHGGGDDDLLTYEGSAVGVTMKIGGERADNTDEDYADPTFEALTGTSFDDQLGADRDADPERISGGLGNDTLISDGAQSVLSGGRGIDVYQTRSEGSVTVVFDQQLSGIVMNGSTVAVSEGTETLLDGHTHVLGTGFDDVMVGRAGIRDTLDGGKGDDSIDLRDGTADAAANCGDGVDTIRYDIGVDDAPTRCENVNPIEPLPPVADPVPPAADPQPRQPAPGDPAGDDENSAAPRAPRAPRAAQVKLFEPLTYAAVARRRLVTSRFPVQAVGVRSVVRIRVYPRQARQMGLRVPSGQRFMVIGLARATSTRAGNLVMRPKLTFRAKQALARTARNRRAPRRIAVHLDVLVAQGGNQSRVIRGFTLRR